MPTVFEPMWSAILLADGLAKHNSHFSVTPKGRADREIFDKMASNGKKHVRFQKTVNEFLIPPREKERNDEMEQSDVDESGPKVSRTRPLQGKVCEACKREVPPEVLLEYKKFEDQYNWSKKRFDGLNIRNRELVGRNDDLMLEVNNKTHQLNAFCKKLNESRVEKEQLRTRIEELEEKLKKTEIEKERLLAERSNRLEGRAEAPSSSELGVQVDLVQSAPPGEYFLLEDGEVGEDVLMDSPSEAARRPQRREVRPSSSADGNDYQNGKNIAKQDEEELIEDQSLVDGEDENMEEAEEGSAVVEDANGEESEVSEKKDRRQYGTSIDRLLYDCPVKSCASSFAKFDELENHMATHPGKQDFFCNVCKRRFSSKVRAMAHVGKRMGKLCCQCGRQCRTATHSVVHMRCHSGERPYVCETCGNAFTRLTHLKGHMQKH